jgi:hypothetical protein
VAIVLRQLTTGDPIVDANLAADIADGGLR